ncbi:MAG: YhjD/YihY/BrkB family envelope integrity protein, partial [Steroidobacteraceae bacterium]
MRELFSLLRATATAFVEDRVSRKAAALAFYTVFSLAPLLIISIAIAGAFFGAEAARGEIVGQIRGLVGEEGARAIEGMLQNAGRPGSGLVAALTGIATLLLGATTAFAELKEGLDQIWGAPRERVQGIFYTLMKRVLSFGVILSIGFLLLVS